MADEWLTIHQAAEISGYHTAYLYYLIKTGKVKAQKFATVWQVSPASLKVYLHTVAKMGEKRGPKTGA